MDQKRKENRVWFRSSENLRLYKEVLQIDVKFVMTLLGERNVMMITAQTHVQNVKTFQIQIKALESTTKSFRINVISVNTTPQRIAI